MFLITLLHQNGEFDPGFGTWDNPGSDPAKDPVYTQTNILSRSRSGLSVNGNNLVRVCLHCHMTLVDTWVGLPGQ